MTQAQQADLYVKSRLQADAMLREAMKQKNLVPNQKCKRCNQGLVGYSVKTVTQYGKTYKIAWPIACRCLRPKPMEIKA